MPKYDFSSFDEHPTQKYNFDSFDSHESVAPKAAEQSPISYLESLLRGGAQGATMGFADELAGAGDAIPKALDVLTGGSGSLEDVINSYKAGRDQSRQAFDAAEQANPKTFMAGQVGGGIAPAVLAAPEAIGAKALAKVGALAGAVSGAGTSKADLTEGEVMPFVKDVGSNAAIGSILNVLGGKVAEKLGAGALEKTAAERAVKATGATKSQVKNLMKSPPSAEGGNRLLEQGKNLLSKNDFTDSPIVTLGATAEDVLTRSEDLLQKSGEKIGSILNKLDDQYSVTQQFLKEDFFNPESAIQEIKTLQNTLTKNGQPQKTTKVEFEELQNIIDDIAAYGNTPINFKEANEIKKLVSRKAYDDKGNLSNELMGQVRAIVNDKIEQAADTVTQKIGDPKLYQDYLTAKDFYRTAKDSVNAATGKVAGNLVNRDLGITDYMTGLGGAMAHGTPAGIAAAATHKLAKTYGNSSMAVGANVLSSISKSLTTVPKEALDGAGKALIQSGNPINSRVGRVLVEASQRDDVGKNALIFSLMQNPEYREVLKGLMSDEGVK